MNEAAARQVLLVRAVENAADADKVLTPADRGHAGRTAAELVHWRATDQGERATVEAFVAKRAELLAGTIAERHPDAYAAFTALRWRPWVGVALPLAALAIGAAAEHLADRRHVNLLAFPLLGLIVWNLAVYAWLVARGAAGLAARSPSNPGWIRRLVGGARAGLAARVAGPLAAALAGFALDWGRQALPLAVARAGRILHLSAALLALGAVAGMYVRGLAFEYRAGWESTFLDAAAVQAILAFFLWPAAWIIGQPLPGVEELAALRWDGGATGARAARWIHLYGATVALAVIVPRLVLAALSWSRERALGTRFPLPLDEPYFRRVLTGWRREPAQVRVVPYAYTPAPAAAEGLGAMAARLFGADVRVRHDRPIAFGEEDEPLPLAAGQSAAPDLVVALFNLGSTPETENHGVFLDSLAALAPGKVAVIVDESPYRQRLGGNGAAAERLAERRRAWTGFASTRGLRAVFTDLLAPDLAAAERELEGQLSAEGTELMAAGAPASIELCLVSHTNVGKTTLARTLLGRDVGEVRDAPHVTDVAESHVMLETAPGEALRLWDTPGFGDSVRLAKRLRTADNPIGWMLREVWDRYRNRPLWCSQQAVQAVRESADVVLYIVNATENPLDAAYVAPEMQILTWIGKPVLLLLNQMGPPRAAAEERAQEDRWRACVQPFAVVHGVLTLDAFARCWVQENALLHRVAPLVPANKRAAFGRLADAWRSRGVERFEQSMDILARQLMAATGDRETVEPRTGSGLAARVRRVFGLGKEGEDRGREQAMAALAARADEQIRHATDRLIAVHGLEGGASATVLERLRENYALTEPMSEGKSAAVGGVVSGALTGLAADLAHGGLTLGAGLVTGAIVGALGGAGLARGANVIRGVDRTSVEWSPAFLDGLVRSALLRYLAVAHFGRGRGAYAQGEAPAFWDEEVAKAFAPHGPTFEALWENCRASPDEDHARSDLRALLLEFAVALLGQLYPEAGLVMNEDGKTGFRNRGAVDPGAG